MAKVAERRCVGVGGQHQRRRAHRVGTGGECNDRAFLDARYERVLVDLDAAAGELVAKPAHDRRDVGAAGTRVQHGAVRTVETDLRAREKT